ncbi:MAG: PIN domain-containing protein [Nanoarchaeota archaeon]
MVVFLDTYAIIEIAIQNPSYKPYELSSEEAIATIFNLTEIHFYYLKNFGIEEAEKAYNKVKSIIIPIDDSIIKEANTFKLKNLKRRFSFADCIGYVTARRYNVKFLTGDYSFKDLEGVEFVK